MKVNILTKGNVQEIVDAKIEAKFNEIDMRLDRCNVLIRDIEKILKMERKRT